MRILHLSDFHLRGDGGLSFRVVDTLECLRVDAEHLKTLVQKPDALVITGDLADSGDAHAYSLLHEALAPLSLPVYAVPGNHDRRDRMRELLGNWCPADASVAPYLCYAVEDGPVRLVMLDTMQPGSHSGHCPEAVAGWLERTLAARPGVPTLLFMHHPPFVTGMGAMDEPFENVGRLADILSRSPWVRLCCGHMHRPIVTQWAGCIALTSPAVSMQIDLDLSPEGGDTFRMETPGYLLHHWDGSVLNSHICQIPCSPTFSGPHPFVGSVNPVEG